MKLLIEKFSPQVEQLKELHLKYERFLPAIFFASGFSLDVLTLGEVDDLSNILVLAFYLIACILILAFEYMEIDQKEFNSIWANRFYKYRDDIFHFLLGALLSAFTLFYFKSGSLSNSFVFMFIMLALLLLNEVEIFQKKGVVIRTSLVKLCLVSYLIYVVPILIGKSNSLIFFICILIALFTSLTGYFFLTKFNNKNEQNLKQLLLPHLSVALIFSSLYIFKVLPPVPLSLKYIGVFHGLTKEENVYTTKELKNWWNFWDSSDEHFKAREGDKVYLFTKIFSPGGFSGKVFIHWLYETKDGLRTSDKIPLEITGGRIEGFRGYAYKSNYVPGDWQVRVETEEGLEIGRINFEIVEDTNTDERKFVEIKR